MRYRVLLYTLVVCVLCVGAVLILNLRSHKNGRVLVSIPPLYSLTARVMEGVGTPTLLLEEGASPHDYALKPSQALSISKAKLIFWIGPELEHFLERPLKTRAKSKVITFMQEPSLLFLERPHDHDTTHNHGENTRDPHIWLSPDNAVKMVEIIEQTLIEVDPKNQEAYTANAKKLIVDIRKAEVNLILLLKPVQTQRFGVFHNAYAYFTHAFDLLPPLPLTLTPDSSLKVGALTKLEEQITSNHIKCLFSEPQFPVGPVEALGSKRTIKSDILDPLGHSSTSYVELLTNMGQTIVNCLQNR